MKDYYSILGVSPSAHAADIKRAYRRLAVQYHPDKNPSAEAEALIKDVNEAYDVLGDPERRATYDQRLQNPWSEALTEAEPAPPVHRDPAYRRRRPPVNPANRKPTIRESMAYYLPYVAWLNWAGIAVVAILALDYVLPYQQYKETIVDGYTVRSRRGAHVYTILITETGKHLKLYVPALGKVGDTARFERTMIYSTGMTIYFDDGTIRMAYIYRALILVPLALFVTALLGAIYRQRIEFCFNASVVTGVLLVISLYLIL